MRFRIRNWQVVVLLFIAALAVELAFVQHYNDPRIYGQPYKITPDGMLYTDIAENILQGNGFVNTHSYVRDGDQVAINPQTRDYVVGPVYPLILAVIYGIFGLKAYGAVVVLQAVMNALSAVLAYEIGRTLWGKAWGLIPYVFMLLYPGFSLWGHYILTETTYVLFIMICLYLMARYQKAAGQENREEAGPFGLKAKFSPANWRALVLGIAMGVSNLVRPFFFPVLPLVLVWMLWLKGWNVKSAFKDFLLMVIMVVVVMSPWWVRNYVKYHELIVVTNYGSYEIYAGNNPYTITDQPFYMSAPSYDPEVKARVEQLPVPEQEKEYSRLAKEYILQHPWAFVERTFAKMTNIFWQPITQGDGEAIKMYNYTWDRYYLIGGAIGALLALARPKRHAFLLVLGLYYSTVVSAITVVSEGRYRLPVMPVMVLLGSAGVVLLVRMIGWVLGRRKQYL